MPKQLPRFELSGRQPTNDLHALLRPLPPALAAAVPEAAEHQRLAERFGEANSIVVALQRKLAEAERGDETAARRAIEEGKTVPKPKLPTVQAELAEAERVRGVIAEVVPESAARLLVAAAPHAARVAEEDSERAEELELRALADLRAVEETLAAASDLRSEAAWAAGFRERGVVRPWSRPSPGELARLVAEGIRAIEFERERCVERLGRDGAREDRGERRPDARWRLQGAPAASGYSGLERGGPRGRRELVIGRGAR